MPSDTDSLSNRAIYLAKMMDRLEPGRYVLYLTRPQDPSEKWHVELTQPVTLRRAELTKSTSDAPTKDINPPDVKIKTDNLSNFEP
jgi:hypothetical protein